MQKGTHMSQTKTVIPELPARLSIVSKALGAHSTARTARDAENKSSLDRGDELLERILGADAKHALLIEDFDGVLFELDDMQLLFFEGPTSEDDYFMVSLFGLPGPFSVRSLAGLGQALDEIVEHLRELSDMVKAEVIA